MNLVSELNKFLAYHSNCVRQTLDLGNQPFRGINLFLISCLSILAYLCLANCSRGFIFVRFLFVVDELVVIINYVK